MADYDVIEVKAVGELELLVRFADGVSGLVHFLPSHLYGVFEPLKDPSVFAQVRCDNGFVSWPGDIDLAPDAMHEEIQKNGRWALT
jgi:hypothetical protein